MWRGEEGNRLFSTEAAAWKVSTVSGRKEMNAESYSFVTQFKKR